MQPIRRLLCDLLLGSFISIRSTAYWKIYLHGRKICSARGKAYRVDYITTQRLITLRNFIPLRQLAIAGDLRCLGLVIYHYGKKQIACTSFAGVLQGRVVLYRNLWDCPGRTAYVY